MDKYTELRPASTGNLTVDETLTDFSMGPMVQPLYLHTIVPSVSSGDKFAVKAAFKAGSTTIKTCVSADITAAGHYVMSIFSDEPTVTKLSVTNDVTLDSTVAGSFGAVVQYLSNSRSG